MIDNAVKLIHSEIEKFANEEMVAVDMTIGNGYDTVFLASLVKKVYGFDIQNLAIERTNALIKEKNCADKVSLYQCGHEKVLDIIKEPVDIFVFNLGYLPGSHKSIVTKPDTTIRALHSALKLLKPGGRIFLAQYIGHVGSIEEATAVENFLKQLDQKNYIVQQIKFINQKNTPPIVYLLEKRGKD